MGKLEEFQSWGRYPRVSHVPSRINWLSDELIFEKNRDYLPYGQGRSYGDSCLNDGGVILVTKQLNRLIAFDDQSGVLRCEAGVTLEEILRFAVPRGWFLPVSPGTKFVSVGGAIANDIHGKNHHRAGTFGRHIVQFLLLRSNGERLECSAASNPQLFSATIGGLGLTGLILHADIRLKRIGSAAIDVESIKFRGLEEFFEISASSDQGFEYTVAWLDCLGRGKNFGRGIFYRGNHSDASDCPRPFRIGRDMGVPFNAPDFLLNRWSLSAFNALYYAKQRERTRRSTVHFEPFFYPLDAIAAWNRIYGKRGFFQFQCVMPHSKAPKKPIFEILESVVASGRGSFLAVLKEFGAQTSPGLMSFPCPGVTLCLDFPNQGAVTLELLSRLDSMVRDGGGRIYPAKDAAMSSKSFREYFAKWEEFSHYIDPKFSSSFWRRVTEEKR